MFRVFCMAAIFALAGTAVASAQTAPPTDAANPGYWKSCLGNTTASLRCASISLPSAAGYTALALVQPTGHTDASQCPIPGAVPRYYDVFIHISEVSGMTSATTETIYKLCVAPSSST